MCPVYEDLGAPVGLYKEGEEYFLLSASEVGHVG